MLTKYIQTAMRHAQCEHLPDDGEFYCEIPQLPGVWASGPTRDVALSELQDVLEGWIALGLAMHEAIPAIDGVEISVQTVP